MKIGAQVGLWNRNLNVALQDIQSAGLEGIETFELGEYYSKPNELKSLLNKYNVALTGMYYYGDFITPETQKQELKKATAAIEFLPKVNGEFLVLNSGSDRKEEGYPILAYDRLADSMNKIGKIGHEYGVNVAVHPHFGTMVETRKQLDTLMERLDPDLVSLCLHAVHFLFTGTNPYKIYTAYAKNVIYVHVSDTKGIAKIAEAYEQIRKKLRNREEVFKEMKIKPTNLGQGEIDQKALMKPLLKAGFNGWIIIEGLDPENKPKDGLEISANYLKKEFMKDG
jgi:inosose dehydratase